MRTEPEQAVQARDQVGSQPEADRGVRRRPQGGLPQDQDQPKKGPEADPQEVVLPTFKGVRPFLDEKLNFDLKNF